MHLDDYLGDGTPHGDEVSYNCPLCVTRGHSPDLGGRLWVNYKKQLPSADKPGVFVCYRCEAKGTLEFLLKLIGVESDSQPLSEAWSTHMLRFLHGTLDEPEVIEPEIVSDYIPELLAAGCGPITQGSKFWHYLIERGVSDEDMQFYRMLEGNGRYYDRVVIPTFDFNRKVPFFVARSIKQLYFNIPEKGRIEAPKYLNPKGQGRRFSLFNITHAIAHDQILLTEGVFSSIAAGRNAIATFGKLVSQTQASMLQGYGKGKELVVCFDGDAHAPAVNLAARLSSVGLSVSFVLLPEDHDPATLSKKELDYLLVNRYPYTDTNVLMLQAEGTLKCHSKKTVRVDDEKSLTTRFESSMEWLLRG
jgi:hypothetical protein